MILGINIKSIHREKILLTQSYFLRIKSSLMAVRTLVREAGYKAFFNGVGPTMARAFPANAATFFAYELAMNAMN